MILIIDGVGIVLCLCIMAWLRKLPERYFEKQTEWEAVK